MYIIWHLLDKNNQFLPNMIIPKFLKCPKEFLIY